MGGRDYGVGCFLLDFDGGMGIARLVFLLIDWWTDRKKGRKKRGRVLI